MLRVHLDPNYAEAWCNEGLALNNQGSYNEAIQAFEKAIQLNPKYYTEASKNIA